MNRRRIFMASAGALVLLSLWADDALAQFGGRFAGSDFLSAEDVHILNATGLELLESGKAGDVAEWSNPETKSHGTITLREAFTKDGMNCRRVELMNVPKGNTSQSVWYKHAVCDVPGAGWKYLY